MSSEFTRSVLITPAVEQTTDHTTRFLSSEIVELVTDEGESRIFVHKDALISQSAPFRDALTGGWAEATDRKIVMGDWDSLTVGRMVEFLYCGSYQYPDPAPLSAEGNTPVRETRSRSILSVPLTAAGDQPQSSEPRPLTPVSECLRKFLSTDQQEDPQTAVQRLARFDPALHNYDEALLAHAKVYHLAHYKAIVPLQAMALQHLLDTLSRINPIVAASGSHNVGGIVELARYVYENTDHLENHEEPLRRLVSYFVASNFLFLKSTPDLRQLFIGGGDIVMDVMENVFRRPLPAPKGRRAAPTRGPPTQYVSKISVSSFFSRLCFFVTENEQL